VKTEYRRGGGAIFSEEWDAERKELRKERREVVKSKRKEMYCCGIGGISEERNGGR
jgi:hypothetical protein